MVRHRRDSIRVNFDRTGQNAELAPYWKENEDRPYYPIEEKYMAEKGKAPIYRNYGSVTQILRLFLGSINKI